LYKKSDLRLKELEEYKACELTIDLDGGAAGVSSALRLEDFCWRKSQRPREKYILP